MTNTPNEVIEFSDTTAQLAANVVSASDETDTPTEVGWAVLQVAGPALVIEVVNREADYYQSKIDRGLESPLSISSTEHTILQIRVDTLRKLAESMRGLD